MNNAVKEKWVKALRSGKYEQTTQALKEVGADGSAAYCCLGVLCEIAVEEGVIRRVPSGGLSSVTIDERNYWYEEYSDVGMFGGLLPKSVIEWSGVNDAQQPLAGLNDEYEWNFNQIADLVESTTADNFDAVIQAAVDAEEERRAAEDEDEEY